MAWGRPTSAPFLAGKAEIDSRSSPGSANVGTLKRHGKKTKDTMTKYRGATRNAFGDPNRTIAQFGMRRQGSSFFTQIVPLLM